VRQQAITAMPNVEVYRQSAMSAGAIVEFDFQHIAVATGATWRRDGVARWHIGVTLRTSAALTAVGAGKVTLASTYTGQLIPAC
jgi:hypothetical protein